MEKAAGTKRLHYSKGRAFFRLPHFFPSDLVSVRIFFILCQSLFSFLFGQRPRRDKGRILEESVCSSVFISDPLSERIETISDKPNKLVVPWVACAE